MSWITIWGFLKLLLPTKRIAAWILGVLGAVLALFMGINNSDLKTQFCASEVVSLPPIPTPVPTPVPTATPEPVKKQRK